MACIPSSRTEDKIKIAVNTKKGFEAATEGDSINLENLNSKTRRGRIGKNKANTQAAQGVLLNKTSIRRLTEIECERLQGFSDNWTQYGTYNNEISPIAKTNRYKLIGNAVTVDIVELLANKLKK
jgi:DNA (cytosine-5)-methyltransferase 1